MRSKRILAFLLAACMAASPMGLGRVSAEEADFRGMYLSAAESVSGNSTVSGGVISPGESVPEGAETFDGEGIGSWGMEGSFLERGTIGAADDGTGNKYLQIKGEKISTRSAVKSFEVPSMKTAKVSFKWYVNNLTSDSRGGYAQFTLRNSGEEVFSLYHSDVRPNEDKSAALYYSTKGFEGKTDTGVKVEKNTSYQVDITFDFLNHTVSAALGGTVIVDQAPIGEFTTKVDEFAFTGAGTLGSGKTFTVDCGIDNFFLDYEENTEVDTQAVQSLEALPQVTVTKPEWDAGYQHPQSVKATLVSGETYDMPIDQSTWTCTPVFDSAKKGLYTWTAELAKTEGHANPQGLKASYEMIYMADWVQTHDYEEDFLINVWETVAWGKSMDSTSGTGSLPISRVQGADGDYYMQVGSGQQNGERGNRLDLNSGNIKGAQVQFDILPVNCTSNSNMELMFVAPDSWNSYFTLRFDGNYNLSVYTKCSLTAASTTQAEFAGSVDEANAIDTGLSGKNKWFTVKLAFDYAAHNVDIEIFEKGNETNRFTYADLPIAGEANGLNSMVVHLDRISGKPNAAVGLDNIAIDFTALAATDIASIEQPADVQVAREAFDSFPWPTEVNAVMGDGTKAVLPLGEWTAEPAFDKDKENTYVWTAPLILGDYTNPYQLKATFKMTYTLLPYPVYAHNPNTLELEFGEPLPAEFPSEVMVFLSDGTEDYMPVDQWQPIREFNAEEEGIYVYGANLVAEEGKTQIVRESLAKNENHEDHGTDKDAYVYDVYYRISYFETEDNFNAYTRSMEYLDRGVYAVPSDNGIFVSWRLLATEYGEDVSFNIYRNGSLVNQEPVSDRTNYVDTEGKAGDTYTVAKLLNGTKAESAPVIAADKNYLSIPLQKPDPQPSKTGELAEYTVNDASVADVDGDGEYEVIVKWYPSNSFDSGKAVKPSSPTIFDVYRMDGTPLWRLNMGLEMPSGAHFNQFMFYDLDEDGRAELFLKTSDGTVSYKPNADGLFDMKDESTIVSYIGDKSVVPGTNINDNGHVNGNSNEYVTVFNGLTGEEIDTIDFVNKTGDYADWHAEEGKNDGGNRSARYNIAVAYLPRKKEVRRLFRQCCLTADIMQRLQWQPIP